MFSLRLSFARVLVAVICLLIFAEWGIYWILIGFCHWPQLDVALSNHKVLLLADSHLLGWREGHWFDKLRREWQMWRSFQTAMILLKPEIVFVLGDLLDEGKWCSDEEFSSHVKRFWRTFAVSTHTKLYTVIGNHDVGFHDNMSPHKIRRFSLGFTDRERYPISDKPDDLVSSLKLSDGVHFVLINSMAFHGDGCDFCRSAEAQLHTVGSSVHNPILLQHFPMYRTSLTEGCLGFDGPAHEQAMPLRSRWDCLSMKATDKILKTLKPRLVISGHTHRSCDRRLVDNTPEIGVASFSWRNIVRPSFILLTVARDSFETTRCYLPSEEWVFLIYGAALTLVVLSLLRTTYCQLVRPSVKIH